MTHDQAIKLTAEITTATVAHMANEAGLTVAQTLVAIKAGGAARTRFDAYLAVAAQAV